MITMPALTLWQPWACLVDIGAKQYETRSFPIPTRLLGERVAIHAAARRCFVNFDHDTDDAITEVFGGSWWKHYLHRGVIVATAVLAESIPTTRVIADPFGDYTEGRWAWRLEDVRSVRPRILAKGRQQIGWAWEMPKGFEP